MGTTQLIFVSVGGALVVLLAPWALTRLTPVRAVILSLVILCFVPHTLLAGLPGGSYAGPVVATILLLAALIRSSKDLRAPTMLVPLAVFYVLTWVSGIVLADFDFYYSMLGPLAIAAYVLVANFTAIDRAKITSTLIIIGGVQALLSFWEAFTGAPLIGVQGTESPDNPLFPGLERTQGTLGHPLTLSVILLVAFALTISAPKIKIGWRLLSLAVLLPALVLTGSSGAIVMAAVVVVWAVLTLWKNPVAKIIGALVVVIAALIIHQRVDLGTIAGDLSGQAVQHRTNSITAIPKLLTEQDPFAVLFGNGFWSVGRLYAEGRLLINDGFPTIDNQWTTALVQTGIIGTAALITFALLAFFRAPKPYQLVLLIFLLTSISFDFLTWYAMLLIFMVGAGMSARLKEPKRPRAASEPDVELPLAIRR